MEVGKISDGIQATIDLLESVYIQAKDIEIQGLPIMTAIKNLKILKEATVRAENGVPPEESVAQPEPGPEEGDNLCME